jgi:hypothetical protein
MASKQCGECIRPSNNKHFDCPPRMSDGRIFTDYRPRCDINFVDFLDASGRSMDSYKYRQYLTNNTDAILTRFRDNSYYSARCGPCMEPYNEGTMLQEQERTYCDAKTCIRKVVGDGQGVGMGRDFGPNSAMDPKFLEFKKKEQAELKVRANCCGSKLDYENYYPPNNVIDDQDIMRNASVGGGTPLQGGDLINPMVKYELN